MGARALYDAHFAANRAGDASGATRALDELRALVDGPGALPDVAQGTEPQRTWLAMALFNHLNRVLETDAAAATPILQELRQFSGRTDVSEKQRTQFAMALVNVGRAALARGDRAFAAALAQEHAQLPKGEGEPSGPPWAQQILAALAERFPDDLRARACAQFAACQRLANEGHTEEALWISLRLGGEFGTSTDETIREAVVASLLIRAALQERAGQLDDALLAYERILVDFHPGTTPPLRDLLANALLAKGKLLAASGQVQASLAAYTALLERFGDSSEPQVRRWVATAFVNRGVGFAALGELRAAYADFVAMEENFGADTDSEIVCQLALALANQALVLRAGGHPDQVVIVCDQLIRRFAAHEDSQVREMVRQALEMRAEATNGAPQ